MVKITKRVLMKYWIIGFLSLLIALSLAVLGVIAFPYYFYNQTVNKNLKTSWFYIDKHKKDFVTAYPFKPYNLEDVQNENLWQNFHFRDLIIPVPYPSQNPFFTVRPNLSFDKAKKQSNFSLEITDLKGRVYNKIYALPFMNFPDYLTSQKLFDLPVIREAVLKRSTDQIWKDVFNRDISKWDIGLEEMAYNLYLLNFRSKFIDKKVKSFYLYEGTLKGILELESSDKDFKQEIILEKRGRQIMTYMVLTDISRKKSENIRNHILKNIEFRSSTPSLTDIIVKEFKALDYREQVSATGMLYLISAWSHNTSRVEILERMIYNLERGAKAQYNGNAASELASQDFVAPNVMLLEPIYVYYYNRYGRFYSAMDVKGLRLNSDLLLKKKIELERKLNEKKELLDSAIEPPPKKRKTVEQEFEELIEKTKGKKNKLKQKIRID